MATNIKYILGGSEINPPLNWRETSFEVNFDRDGNAKTRIVSENFEFVRENADTILSRVFSGTTGGVGILEGLPLQVEIERNGVVEKPYNGYIDLTKDATFSPESCNVKGVERKSIEWLEEKADGFSFEYLKSIGIITNDDYKFIPYVLNSIPDYEKTAIAMISAYVVIEQLRESVQKVKDIIAELSNPFVAISSIIKAALLVVYLITLIAALVKLIKDIVTLLIQPIKYHACMNVKTLLEKGCQHLGLTLSSSILSDTVFSKAYIMPEKFNNPSNSDDKRILGFTIPKKEEQDGYYKGTFGDLIRALKDTFNAKIVIKNDVLHFERLDNNITPPQYVLNPPYNIKFETNADECIANYFITFQTDTIEKNTLQEYTGTAFQVILSPINSDNPDLSMIKGLTQVRLPFALAKRKTELTVPETIIKTFLDILSVIVNALISAVNALIMAINQVISIINKVIKALKAIGIKITLQVGTIPTIGYLNLGNIIANRLNVLKIETDFTSVPKIFLMDLGTQSKFNKLSTGNETFMSAEYLYKNFHFINSFLPTIEKPNGNQYIKKPYINVPFGFQHYQQVRDNNQITIDGLDAIIESFKWNVYDQRADMRVRISTLLTNNLTPTYLIPNGK
jgi:hypothetical protein